MCALSLNYVYYHFVLRVSCEFSLYLCTCMSMCDIGLKWLSIVKKQTQLTFFRVSCMFFDGGLQVNTHFPHVFTYELLLCSRLPRLSDLQ